MLNQISIVKRSLGAALLGIVCAYTPGVYAESTGDMSHAGPDAGRLLPKFHCDIEKVKANSDPTTRDRQIRRIKRTYKRCISDYKADLAIEQQKLQQTLPSVTEPEAHKFITARINLMQKVLDTEYKLPKVLGAGGNSLDRRDFYDSAHGQ